jgi:hypothetical protein
MNTAPPEHGSPNAEPDFTIPRLHTITEANWPDFQAKGYVFHENISAHSAAMRHADVTASVWEREDVLFGEAFDEREGRPLAHMPGIGVYFGPELSQSSSDTGPASN